MQKTIKQTLLLLRLTMGWLFFYAGIDKLLDPSWTAEGFLKGAKTFSGLYEWLASAGNIGWVNFLNEWGLTVIGVGLILGAFTRLAAYFGVLLMALYYFPSLEFPYIGHGFIVDEHIIYAAALLVLAYQKAGEYFGLDKDLKKKFKKAV